ncbi:MAG TPA: RNA polymerase sigma factor region1.1 domain-containing protein, partial [Verrucomicrobiae bacterium]
MSKLKAPTPARRSSAQTVKANSTERPIPKSDKATSHQTATLLADYLHADMNGKIPAANGTTDKAAEIAEKIKELVRLAQEQGYLTYGDVTETMPESLVSAEELDDV